MKFKFRDNVIINTEFYPNIKGKVIECYVSSGFITATGYYKEYSYKVHLADFTELTHIFEEKDLTLD